VVREGQVVLDRRFGCPPDALFWIFSASKPFVALLIHLLAQRGELSLDDRVAEHWPRFAQHGKDSAPATKHVDQRRAQKSKRSRWQCLGERSRRYGTKPGARCAASGGNVDGP
jgi:hypothetical protein